MTKAITLKPETVEKVKNFPTQGYDRGWAPYAETSEGCAFYREEARQSRADKDRPTV